LNDKKAIDRVRRYNAGESFEIIYNEFGDDDERVHIDDLEACGKALSAAADARKKITAEFVRGGLSREQRAVLQGMSTALQWVCGDGGISLQQLLDGRPIGRRAEHA
jgi:hypothetical protein